MQIQGCVFFLKVFITSNFTSWHKLRGRVNHNCPMASNLKLDICDEKNKQEVRSYMP